MTSKMVLKKCKVFELVVVLTNLFYHQYLKMAAVSMFLWFLSANDRISVLGAPQNVAVLTEDDLPFMDQCSDWALDGLEPEGATVEYAAYPTPNISDFSIETVISLRRPTNALIINA